MMRRNRCQFLEVLLVDAKNSSSEILVIGDHDGALMFVLASLQDVIGFICWGTVDVCLENFKIDYALTDKPEAASPLLTIVGNVCRTCFNEGLTIAIREMMEPKV